MQKLMKVTTNVEEYASTATLPKVEQRLMKDAAKAMLDAYAPYSEFKVGAAVLLEDGTVVIGNNQENGAYPSGLCAERVAFFAARANHPTQRIMAVAIQASSRNMDVNQPVSPCGSCRQVMAEYERNQTHPIPILIAGETGPVYRMKSVSELLPLFFDGAFLKKI